MKKHDKIKTIIDKWMYRNFYENYAKPQIIVNFEVCGRNIYIYSDKPGIIIGSYGKYINELKDMLQNQKIYKNIHVVELRRGVTHEINVKRKLL